MNRAGVGGGPKHAAGSVVWALNARSMVILADGDAHDEGNVVDVECVDESEFYAHVTIIILHTTGFLF